MLLHVIKHTNQILSIQRKREVSNIGDFVTLVSCCTGRNSHYFSIAAVFSADLYSDAIEKKFFKKRRKKWRRESNIGLQLQKLWLIYLLSHEINLII